MYVRPKICDVLTCSQCLGDFRQHLPSGDPLLLPNFRKPNSEYALNSSEHLNFGSVNPTFCVGLTVRYSMSLRKHFDVLPKTLSPCMYCFLISKIIVWVFSPRCVCVTAPLPLNRYTRISRARSEVRAKPDKKTYACINVSNLRCSHPNLTDTCECDIENV